MVHGLRRGDYLFLGQYEEGFLQHIQGLVQIARLEGRNLLDDSKSG